MIKVTLEKGGFQAHRSRSQRHFERTPEHHAPPPPPHPNFPGTWRWETLTITTHHKKTIGFSMNLMTEFLPLPTPPQTQSETCFQMPRNELTHQGCNSVSPQSRRLTGHPQTSRPGAPHTPQRLTEASIVTLSPRRISGSQWRKHPPLLAEPLRSI